MSSGNVVQNLVTGKDIPSSVQWTLSSLSDNASKYQLTQLQANEPVLGVAILLDADGTLNTLAISGRKQALLFNAKGNDSTAKNTKKGSSSPSPASKRVNYNYWSDALSSQSSTNCTCAFGMARIALHIKKSLGVEVIGADIISSVINVKTNIKSPGLFFNKYKSQFSVKQCEIDDLWDNIILTKNEDPTSSELESLCLRAWVSAIAGNIACIPRPTMVNTSSMKLENFNVVYQMAVEIEQLDSAKPRERIADFASIKPQGDNHVMVNNRYKTRARHSEKGRLICFDKDNNQYHGRTMGAKGRSTTLKTHKNVASNRIIRALFKGKEELTLAEQAKETHLLKLLQGVVPHDSPFTRQIWFPTARNKAALKRVKSTKPRGRLNQSQANVVEAMVAGVDPIVVVHGPPGTGKTSTISVAVQEWIAARNTVWLVAQSNVGVKNIAEKLCKDNATKACKDKVEFRIIVSKEFHFEWHEHIYEQQISDRLIRSDEFPDDPRHVVQLFQGVKVVLCTLSSLSNPALVQKKVFSSVPVQNLVVDEASQIGVFEYMHLFEQFGTLEKACFFGDPKQLPPYGLDAAPNLQCIFDIRHLQLRSYFLDTQYRMPTPIGTFISQQVYGSKLRSQHHEHSSSCLALVDAGFDSTEEKAGTSWKNNREVQAIAHLVRNYYRNKNFCIITPYDGQRAALQASLKREGLPWGNVFNVDSFQGNEADYVLISVVRTTGPGFMKSVNRVNVMLTRCKEGMVIVSNRRFMHSKSVKKTLLGKLGMHWEKLVGEKQVWRDWRDVSTFKARLPGLSAAGQSISSGEGMQSLVSNMEQLEL